MYNNLNSTNDQIIQMIFVEVWETMKYFFYNIKVKIILLKNFPLK